MQIHISFFKCVFSLFFIFAFTCVEASSLNGMFKQYTLRYKTYDNPFYYAEDFFTVFEVKNGEHVGNANTIYYLNSFSGLNDFILNYFEDHGNFTFTYEAISNPGIILPGVGFGTFSSLKGGWNSEQLYGSIIIGEKLSETAFTHLLKNSVMTFEGSALTDSHLTLELEFDPQSRILHGRLGEFYVETGLNLGEFKGECFDLIVFSYSKGYKKQKGTLSLMLIQDGENSWILAGGYVLDNQADLVYLKQVL